MPVIDHTPYGNRLRGDLDLSGIAAVISSETEHRERITRYFTYWRTYHGQHWRQNTNVKVLSVNYSRALADLLVAWLMKEGFAITIPEDPATPYTDKTEREFVKAALDDQWEKNQRELWGMECGQMGSVSGDVFVRPSWDEEGAEGPFVRVELIPPQYCFPEFGGLSGADRKKMTKFTIVFPRYTDEGGIRLFGMRRTRVRWDAEVWTKDFVQYWEGKTLRETKPNPLGEIPIIHIPNLPVAGEFYGLSDMVDIVDLQEELDAKGTDISSVINYHGSPVTVLYGASIGELEQGADRVWSAPVDARIENLSLSGELDAALAYFMNIKNAMFEMVGIPPNALGKEQAISNTSAAALAIQYLPMTTRRKLKALLYGAGLKSVNRMILKILELKDPAFSKKFSALRTATPVEARNKLYRTKVSFPTPFPRDEAMELANAEKKLGLGLTTKKRVLVDMGVGDQDAERIVNDALEERIIDAQLENAGTLGYEEEEPSGNPSPNQPNPVVQGEIVSAKATPPTSGA